jgi:hypothetical protein
LLIVLRFGIYFDIDSRTLNALYPLLVVFATALVDRLPAGAWRWAATAGAVLWCLIIVRFGVRTAQGVRRDGSVFTASGLDPTYRELRAADIAGRVPDGCHLRTNAPELLFLVGVEATPVDAAGAQGSGPPACVVWVDGVGTLEPVTVDRAQLVAAEDLTPIFQDQMITIYAPSPGGH